MADTYAATVLLKAQSFLDRNKERMFENRPQYTKILEGFQANNQFVLPNLAQMKTSTKRVQETLYRTTKRMTLGGAAEITCDPSGETGGSDKVDVSWTPINFSLKINRRQFLDNHFSAAETFANDFYNAEISVKEELDARLIAFLEANRCQTNNGESGTFDAVNYVMPIAAANANRFYNKMLVDMLQNNYNNGVQEYHNTSWIADQEFTIAQGAANDTNLAFQFKGFVNYPSNLITPDATYAKHYIVPNGGVAFVTWNDPMFDPSINDAANDPSKGYRRFRMNSILMPGVVYDVFEKTSCGDSSADGGDKQDDITNWQFNVYYTILQQPFSTAGESAIYKYGILA
jgi:hypothetical protein